MKAIEAIKNNKIISGIGNGIKAFFADVKKRTIFIVSVVSVIAIALILFLCFQLYVSDYYAADYNAIAAVGKISETDIYMLREGVTVFRPHEAKAGFIFYPGAKVEYISYAPLMDELASRGIVAVLIEMPYNLAILDPNAAEGITEAFPNVEEWYIGGHSLGGVVAATYLKNNPDEIDGLVLMGSYATDNVKGSRVLSIYGDRDRVLDLDKYEDCKKNLPVDFTEVIIKGGNHSGFGMYGNQEGDGLAGIEPIEQIIATADAISEFIDNK